jgi:hypothetical protein
MPMANKWLYEDVINWAEEQGEAHKRLPSHRHQGFRRKEQEGLSTERCAQIRRAARPLVQQEERLVSDSISTYRSTPLVVFIQERVACLWPLIPR